jgi:hypothetical protein
VPASAVLLTAAAPASAAGSISSPAPDTVYTSGTSTTVSADLDACEATTTLKVVNPQGDNSWTLTSARPAACGDVVGKPTAPRKPSVTPTWTAKMPNGRFTVTLSGGVSATRYFYTSLPPGTPTGLTAQGTGASQVDLTWTYDGAEPDLTGFVISDDKGNTFPVDDPAARSYTAYYSNPEPGTYDYAFTVKALRKNGAGDGTVPGAGSQTATTRLVTPQPPPSPTPEPSSSASPGASPGASGAPAPGGGGATSGPGGGATSGPGGSTGGGSGSKATAPALSIPSLNPVTAQRRNYALSFNTFSPSLGIPKLPPLPATTFAAAAEGSYQPVLPYQDASPSDEPGSVLADPIAAVTSLDSAQLAKSLAFALILLVAAAHLRLFLSGHKAE